jgi:hypothetical protein
MNNLKAVKLSKSCTTNRLGFNAPHNSPSVTEDLLRELFILTVEKHKACQLLVAREGVIL